MLRAETIAKALRGRRTGKGWQARCPAHDDRTPSLSISDGRDGVVVHCHTGCEQAAVIDALRSRALWHEGKGKHRLRWRRRQPHVSEKQPEADDTKRIEVALSVFRFSVQSAGTLVETYLRSRGLRVALPPTIRFHAALRHPAGESWPAIVALVTRGSDDEPLAVHRTYLARNGKGKAPVEPSKLMLGPCRGGAVRLAQPGETLMVGEGIETCLAAMQAIALPAWAALSTSGLRTLDLPPTVQDVIVLADGDDPGEAAARDAAGRWRREGRRVRIARPPRGQDFNDMLQGVAPCSAEVSQ